MGLPFGRPTSAFGAPKPSTRQRKTRQAKKGWERAVRRHAIARLATASTGSLQKKQDAVEAAMKAGLIAPGSIPSRETIRTLENAYRSGKVLVEDFLDGHRTGRPRKQLALLLEQEIDRVVKGGFPVSALELTHDLHEIAVREGLEPPTYHDVHRRFSEAGRFRRAVARHGSRAGEIDATAHTRVPSREVHDVWALDELTLPVWSRRWNRVTERWESLLRDVIIVMDLKSTAVVGWEFADADRRENRDGFPTESGFAARDVLGALLNAACPELAPDSTRHFAGYLPTRIRWDNATPHKFLKGWIDDAPGLDIEMTPIGKRRANRNGAAENRVRLIKNWCSGMFGFKDAYAPTDQVTSMEKANQGRYRTAMAGGTQHRVPRRVPVAPDQLMSEAELRELFDALVLRYNHRHVNSYFRARPVDLYQENLNRRRPRRGHDLVRALEPTTSLVTPKGIRHFSDSREFHFDAEINGALLMVDTAVTYYPDPMNRGAFVDWSGRLHFVRPNDTPSAERASRFAQSWGGLARTYSDEAAAIREADLVVELGRRALEHARASQETAVERLEDYRAGEPREGGGGPRATHPVAQAEDSSGEEAPASPPAFDPWADASADAIVRRREAEQRRSDDAGEVEGRP